MFVRSALPHPVTIPSYSLEQEIEFWDIDISCPLTQCVLSPNRSKDGIVLRKKEGLGIAVLLISFGIVWIDQNWPTVHVTLSPTEE